MLEKHGLPRARYAAQINRALEIQGLRGALLAHFDTHQLTHATQECQQLINKGEESMLRSGKSPA